MEQKFNSLKKFLTSFPSNNVNNNYETAVQPEIGFKIGFCQNTKVLKVKIIGARQLPRTYGNVKPYGYLIKVRVFPEKEKHETKIAPESWPTFNEEFTYSLGASHTSKHSDNRQLFKGKFVSLTAYAILDNISEPTAHSSSTTKLKRFFSFNDHNVTRRCSSPSRRSFNRHSMNNRRTIGAVTYNLDSQTFSQKLADGTISTPDIWRPIKEITSGIQTEPREGKKGSLEVTLSYAVSEDGKNDVVEVSVTKLRCSMQTMQEHEKLRGQLYIKITAFEYDDLIQKMKSDKFEPTISLKIEPNTATLRATVNKYNIEQVKILIRLICKNLFGAKILLGKIEIDSKSDLWGEIVAAPLVPITRMINFE